MSNGNIAGSDLQWLLLKNNTSFIHKRVGSNRVFSAEKGNLKNVHAFKYSGLANERSLDISANSSNHGIVLTHRDPKASKFAVKSALVSKGLKGKSGRKAAGVVIRQCGSDAGRLDLRKDALARASAIIASQSARKAFRVRSLRGKHAVVAAPAEE